MVSQAVRKSLLLNLQATIRRFPIPVTCCLFLTLVGIFASHSFFGDWSNRFYIWGICSFLASLAVALLAEARNWPASHTLLASLLLLLLFLLPLFSFGMNLLPYAFLIPGLAVLVSVAPHFHAGTTSEDCSRFNSALYTGFFSAFATAFVLYAGVILTLVSIAYLFGVTVSLNSYVDIGVLLCTLFAPVQLLTTLPRNTAGRKTSSAETFITACILSPLVLLYLLILYAYIARISLLGELPRGQLALMIIAFGCIGSLTHLSALSPAQDGRWLPSLIRRYFYPALLVPVAALFATIGMRIAQYGITEQRYAVLIAALWLGFSAIYMTFSRRRFVLWVPCLLAALLILSSFGPWGAVAVSGRSQVARLETLLEENKLLVDGKLALPVSDNAVSYEARSRISAIIEYLTLTRKLNLITGWFSYDLSRKKIPAEVMSDLGLEYIDRWQRRDDFEAHTPIANLSYRSNSFTPAQLFSVQGYDQAAIISFYPLPNIIQSSLVVGDGKTPLTLTFSKGQVRVGYPGQPPLTRFNLNPVLSALDKQKAVVPLTPAQEKLLTLTHQAGKMLVTLRLYELAGRKEKKRVTVQSASFALLIKDKK